MQLLKGRSFLRREFTHPRPTYQTLYGWVESGEVAGRIIGKEVYVDMNRWTGKVQHKKLEGDDGLDLFR